MHNKLLNELTNTKQKRSNKKKNELALKET